MRGLWMAAVLAAAGTAAAEDAQPAAPVEQLPDMVVTATRSAHAAFDLPAAIDAVELDGAADAGPEIKTAEFLARVPGVLARDRQNYAQDEQISIRGYGARSTFGVRGLRLYTDGIPASMPDGQGQTSHFNLGGGDRIEVLRGPYSALYGNSSGGVIQLFSADPPEAFEGSVGAAGGSYGQRQLKAGIGDTAGPVGYSVQADAFQTDGYRDHSEAERYLANGKLVWKLGDSSLTLLANGIRIPEASDPQGLTLAEFSANPKQAAPAANTFNTRKSVDQVQGGAIWQQRLGDGTQLHVLAYGGRREVFQMLSVPIAVQTGSALHSGGVVDLGSDYGGFDWRANWKPKDAPYEITYGFSGERQNQHRRGYENFVGARPGEQGALRRDELDIVYNADQYLQGEWRFAPKWTASGGLRHSEVRFGTEDRYIAGANGDDSGKKEYEATAPVAGLVFAPAERWRVYASYGRGFETPTFNELAYSPGGGGMNFNLRAARSDNFELGAKHRFAGGGGAELALFDARTRDEIVVDSAAFGRTSYKNANTPTRRRGLELGLNRPLFAQLSASLAYTLLQAEFEGAGARIAGVPRSSGYGELRWGAASWYAALNAQALSHATVSDAGAIAPGYALLGAGAGYTPAGSPFSAYLRLQNLLDAHYAGSVIVNDANGRYFEPGMPLNAYAGISYKFQGKGNP